VRSVYNNVAGHGVQDDLEGVLPDPLEHPDPHRKAAEVLEPHPLDRRRDRGPADEVVPSPEQDPNPAFDGQVRQVRCQPA